MKWVSTTIATAGTKTVATERNCARVRNARVSEPLRAAKTTASPAATSSATPR